MDNEVMSIEEFDKQCEKTVLSFFSNIKDPEKFLGKMSLDDFNCWMSARLIEYEKNTSIIREYILKIRNSKNYHDYSNPNDPIKEEPYSGIIKAFWDVYRKWFDVFYSHPTVKQKDIQWKEKMKQDLLEKEKIIEVNGKTFKALEVIDVLWVGWDCDDKAWLVNDDGTIKLVASNHGSLYFETKDFLEEKIKEYEQAIENSKKMLEILNSNKIHCINRKSLK